MFKLYVTLCYTRVQFQAVIYSSANLQIEIKNTRLLPYVIMANKQIFLKIVKLIIFEENSCILKREITVFPLVPAVVELYSILLFIRVKYILLSIQNSVS